MGLGDTVFGLFEDESHSNLNGFLSKFNSTDGKWINQIDSLNTFDIKFEFYPRLGENEDKSFGDKLLGSLKSSVTDALNNATGGLLGSFMNDTDIMSLRGDFVDNGDFGKITSLEYMARGNGLVGEGGLLGGASDEIANQLILDLSYYVQDVQLPQITMQDGGNAETMVGDFPVNGRYVKPSQNSFSMNIVNTKSPVLEKIFYPWMREVTLPYWAYDEQPYTTADITIDYTKHADVKYVFVNSRPNNIVAINGTNSLNSSLTRQVNFIFDYMFVISDLKTASGEDALKSLGKGLLNDAGSMLGL